MADKRSARDNIMNKKSANQEMMDVQLQLKNNSISMNDYCKGLDDWRADMAKKDKSKALRENLSGISSKGAQAKRNVPLPPIRNKVDI